MKIQFQTNISVNVNEIVQNCEVHVSKEELIADIRSIVCFWAEQRLLEDDWSIPNSPKAIRDYLVDNGIVSEKDDIFDLEGI
jgi:hypothetical protein